jgi:hypothetical protein
VVVSTLAPVVATEPVEKVVMPIFLTGVVGIAETVWALLSLVAVSISVVVVVAVAAVAIDSVAVVV